MTFSAVVTRDERVLVSCQGRQVAALAGTRARRLLDQLARAQDEDAEQLVLARATGNFKRGNER